MMNREGDLIETAQDLIFDVKGLVHPLKYVIAFVRYFPHKEGERRRRNEAYSKVYSLSRRYTLLKERFPQYLVYDPVFDETLCEVPVGDVKKRYDPVAGLQELQKSKTPDELESKALFLAEQLKEKARIPWKAIGISGSILVGLHTPSSDVDLVVYGSENCRKAYSALMEFLKEANSLFKPYNREELKALFDFRSKDTAMSFEDFVRTDSRKVMQGKFMGTDYFVRFVKDWNEVNERYGDIQYKNVGYAKVKGTISDNSESIFTPCTYKVENAAILEGSGTQPIQEIASFRGRFCEHARTGEKVIAQGKVENVTERDRNREYSRLLIGNKPSDYMVIGRIGK
jgi:predicted nucleotidyltransferase